MSEALEKFQQWSDHLDNTFVFAGTGRFSIVETDETGAGTVTFEPSHPWVKIHTKKNIPPIAWLNVKKCADGAFFLFKGDAIELHVVELKNTVTTDVWRKKARNQIHGMILNALALVGLMQLQIKLPIFCYVAFKDNEINPPARSMTGSLIEAKGQIGVRGTFGHLEEWHAERIEFPPQLQAVLVKVQRDASGDATYDLSQLRRSEEPSC